MNCILQDPKIEVRLEGISALHRFQEIENPLDRIIEMFKVLIEHDKFAKVPYRILIFSNYFTI